MGKLLLVLIVKYVENHPDQIVELLGEATKAGIKALRAHNDKSATAPAA